MKVALFTVALASTVGVAQAHPLDTLIQRDATQESRFANDVAQGKIDVHNAALLERQEGDLHKLEANVIGEVSALDPQSIAQLRQSESNLAGALNWAEKHRAKFAGAPEDRMHLRVAAQREAAQEGMLARELKRDRITPYEAGELEAVQGKIALAQFDAVDKRHESMQAARSIQDMQNTQDYAIRKDPDLS